MDNFIYLCPDYYKNILESFNSGETHAVFDCNKCYRNCHVESQFNTICLYDYVNKFWFTEE